MYGKIALEEAWAIPENFQAYDVASLAPKGVIGGDLIANLLDVHGTRLQQMDDNGLDLMVLSLSSPGPQGQPDPDEAARLARLANDRLAATVAQNPTRFAGLVSLSMHDPVQAGEELRRCLQNVGKDRGKEGKGKEEEQLEGFVGAIVNDYQSAGPDGNTMLFYDQPAYDAFWRVAEELDCPVYLHPRAATPLVHAQLWAGRPWLEFSAWGYAERVGTHLLGIITGGVLDRFPKLKIVVGHLGEHMYVFPPLSLLTWILYVSNSPLLH